MIKEALVKKLKEAFLGSEFPHNIYRNTIKEVFGIRTFSWYGLTERCGLAYEKNEEYLYEPFLTYGYGEAIPVNEEY